MTPDAMRWHAGGASVRGTAHERRGQPNQDAVWWTPRRGAELDFAVAVADGHGAPAYYRSEVGAQLALQALESALSWYFDEPDSLERLAEDIVTIWQRLVDDHSSKHPASTLNVAAHPREAYGTTLVGVAGSARQILAVQLGDGDLLVGYADGRVERPLPDDLGLKGEQTYSLCLPDAAARMRLRQWDLSDAGGGPEFALVATDGVSKSFVSEAAFEEVVQSYRKLVRTEDELFATLEALPDWLTQVSANGSGDDASLCLASRRFPGGGNNAGNSGQGG
jgi:serine/threonine protein phosphatase PrpC